MGKSSLFRLTSPYYFNIITTKVFDIFENSNKICKNQYPNLKNFHFNQKLEEHATKHQYATVVYFMWQNGTVES